MTKYNVRNGGNGSHAFHRWMCQMNISKQNKTCSRSALNTIRSVPVWFKMETTTDTISVGDYIVIQRQKYTKLHKFNSLDSTAMLGKELLELRNIASKPYSTTFKMVSKNGAKGGKRISTLEPCTDRSYLTESIIASKGSGTDNRNITDDGSSQSLTPEEIQKLRDECSSSTEIVSQIVENSKTFASKTGQVSVFFTFKIPWIYLFICFSIKSLTGNVDCWNSIYIVCKRTRNLPTTLMWHGMIWLIPSAMIWCWPSETMIYTNLLSLRSVIGCRTIKSKQKNPKT